MIALEQTAPSHQPGMLRSDKAVQNGTALNVLGRDGTLSSPIALAELGNSVLMETTEEMN